MYGTLKRHERNNFLLEAVKGKKLKGFYQTLIAWPMVSLGQCPALISKPGDGHQVKGELWEVDERGLAHLDALEQHPYLYRRSEIVVTRMGVHDNKTALTYFLNTNNFDYPPNARTYPWWSGVNLPEPV